MTVAIQIPLKSRRSTRVPNKNFRDLCGKPLCHWLIDELLAYLPREYDIYIDSESESVMEVFTPEQRERLDFHQRMDWFAGDQANGNHLMNQFVISRPQYSYFIQIYVTAVTLSGEIVRECIDSLISSSDCFDSILTVTEETGWVWKDGKSINYDSTLPNGLPRSQDAMFLKETTGLYGITRDAAFRTSCRIGNNPCFYKVAQKYAFDIDTMEDFREAERILSPK